ncbi:MAG: hypothetical protein ACYC2H_10110 [Thermoplasmatota archaeon]
MGRPPTLVRDCQEAHEGLLAQGYAVGERIPRPDWDMTIARLLERQGGSFAQVRNFTATGRLHGFWEVHAGHGPGNHGWVALCAATRPPVVDPAVWLAVFASSAPASSAAAV